MEQRGFAIVNDYFAKLYKEEGLLAIPRKLSKEELKEDTFTRQELAYVILDSHKADLRLVLPDMHNHRIARQQAEEGFVSLGSDAQGRHIYTRTKTEEERKLAPMSF